MQESHIENHLIDLLIAQWYTHHYGPDIAPYSDDPQRQGFDSIIMESELRASLTRLNPDLPESARHEAYQQIMHLWSSDLMTNNEKFHTMLTDGVTVEYFKDNETKGINVRLLDLESIDNNTFRIVNQLVIKENNHEKRLDVVIYINGLPLVVIELKNALDESATLHKAYTQIQNYKTAVPSIFSYNALCIISDGLDARVSSLSAPFSRYLAWKSPEKKEHTTMSEFQSLTHYMLERQTLLNLIRYNTVFETEEMKNEQTWLLSLVKIKKIAAYHQYYAVQKAVTETLRATHETQWDRKVGVVRHTQWSGKSLSMVFYAGQIVVQPEMKNPTIVILTDRNDLDDQLFATFGSCKWLLRQTPIQANSRDHLKELLKVSGGGIIFTTIQKFSPAEWNVFDMLSDRTNIVVVADEAHRSQYGFSGRLVAKDDTSEIRYGNAKYLRDALPHASFIWFTGTPIEKEDKDTQKVFWEYIDIYDIKQAVDDGATVPLSYESRLIKIRMNEQAIAQIDEAIDEELPDATVEQIDYAKKKNAQIDAVVWHPERLADVARDIVTHFEARQETFEGKAMIVCMTRNIAVKLYAQIIALRPDWHSDTLDGGQIKVVMTSSSDDPADFQAHATTKDQRKILALRLKDPKNSLKLVIVRDMWLTGFDAPCLHTMYVDKKMQGANLMQAIARVNRVYKDKPGWLIVDYIGIGQDLRKAMATYTESGGEGKAVVDLKEVIAWLQEKFEIVHEMLHGIDYQQYFKLDITGKLQLILDVQNFLMSDDTLKQRFIEQSTALSKFFAMAIPSEAAEQIRDHVAFFQAIRIRLNKFTTGRGISDEEVETAMRQIVDEALSSEWVVDIFQAAGIKAPSLSILSDEFLLEVQNMKQKNIALELLKKLLTEDIRVRQRKNMTQGKKFSEMLQWVIKRYHNNQLDTAQVLKELSDLARDMRLEDHKAQELWLTNEEYAFYTLLSENDSTSFLDDQKIKELIHVIVDTVRRNATVDREKREDVRAQLRLTVKKILMKYGFPPDLARMEADRVLEQSELLAESLRKE